MADRAGLIQTDTRSIGEVMQDILRDFREVLRAELRLARVELSGQARKAAKGGMQFAVAGVAGLLAAAALVACAIAALALAMPVWAAALIMAVLLGIIAGTAFSAARAKVRNVDPVPRQTVQSIKEDLEWAKNRTK